MCSVASHSSPTVVGLILSHSHGLSQDFRGWVCDDYLRSGRCAVPRWYMQNSKEPKDTDNYFCCVSDAQRWIQKTDKYANFSYVTSEVFKLHVN